MRVLIINLKKNVQRMERLNRSLTKLGVGYERVEAILGREVPAQEMARNTSKFWWWCINGCPIRAGQYGCAMSHLLAYKRMVAEDIKVACVLEDDAVPRTCLPKLLDRLESWVDASKAQVILISNHRDKDEVKTSAEFNVKEVSGGAFAEGYVITLPAAAKLILKNLPIKCSADEFGLWRRKGWVRLFQAYPEGVNQEWQTTKGYESDVTYRGGNDVIYDTRQMTIVQLLLWKTKRIIGKMCVKIFLR